LRAPCVPVHTCQTMSNRCKFGGGALVLALIPYWAASQGQALDASSHRRRDYSVGNTLYVVPYAHLDTQWRWAYPQVIREFIANTLYDNFALIDKYPHYVFNFSGSRRYEMMKEYYPAEYQRLKAYIKAGRWFPCGSSVDENDANVPSGESLVRHVLYGNHFFKREFGVTSQEFMLPDCFGFPYALPSVLVHCGIKGFSTQKLTWGSAVGIPFKVGTWEGPDGKSIVAALDPGSYAGGVDEDLSQNTSWLARIQNTGNQSGAYVDYHYYGTGDTGGAPTEESVRWIEKSIAGKGPITVLSTKADEMFLSLKPEQVAKLPHYKGELLLTQHSAGSITSQAYMKRWNRKNELLADVAEKASVAATWLGAPYPSDRLYQAWDLVLGSQMHDMLPGTSIPKAYEFCWNDELLALNQFAAVATDAVGTVASAMDTRVDGQYSLLVFNPLSISRQDVVEATIPATEGLLKDVLVSGPDGKPVPTQTARVDAEGVHVIFLAKAPAVGFGGYGVRSGAQPPPAESVRAISAASGKALGLENARFRVRLNESGDIASIYDKVNGREALKSPCRLEFVHHNPAQFPAWNMDWEDAQKPPYAVVGGPAEVKVIESGPVRATIEVTRHAQGSKFVQRISLAAGDAGNRVEVANVVDWQTRQTALKASFSLADGNPEATYDLQLGAIRRGNNNEKKYEVPQHQWFDVTGTNGSYGTAILNDGKFGSDKPDDNTVRLTLLYTPGVRGGYADQSTQDIGRHEFTYAIAPHAGDWIRGDTVWSARRLNQPLRAFRVSQHPGALGKSLSMVSANSRRVEVQAVKKAEDSGEIIVRLRELTGQPANGVRVRFAGAIVSAREVDGQEAAIGPAQVVNGELVATVPGFSLKAFAVKLRQPTATADRPKSIPIALAYDRDVASTDRNRSDGVFDRDGRTIAAEQLPAKLTLGGIEFNLGPTQDGAKNALAARGQTIKLPDGCTQVSLLAASSEGDVEAKFRVSGVEVEKVIQNWGGFIGQWDNRLWDTDPGPNFTRYGQMSGLTPGFVKPAEVAWYSSHRHHPTLGNEFYEYSYLYKYTFATPASGGTLQLPDDPRVLVFAITASRTAVTRAVPAAPLYDTLQRVDSEPPVISPAEGSFADATQVTVSPPLYWSSGSLRYTVDGTEPSASSPAYKGPITLYEPTTIKVASVDGGRVRSVAVARLDVRDTTPPRVVAGTVIRSLGLVRLRFSEAISAPSAEQVGHYRISGAKVVGAAARLDGATVELTLDTALAPGPLRLEVAGVKDLAPRGNELKSQDVDLADRGAVFSVAAFEPKTTKTYEPPSLPTKAGDAWTLNFFCRVDKQPEDRTIIAGFGRAIDGRSGMGRYFTKFPRGINFWVANRDVGTTVPLDIGKWQMLTATYDGATMRLYKNGEKIAEARVDLVDDQSRVNVMPLDAWERKRMFEGEVRDFTIWDQDLPPEAVRKLWDAGK
jgi:alpha-mannosidase